MAFSTLFLEEQCLEYRALVWHYIAKLQSSFAYVITGRFYNNSRYTRYTLVHSHVSAEDTTTPRNARLQTSLRILFGTVVIIISQNP